MQKQLESSAKLSTDSQPFLNEEHALLTETADR